MTVAQEYAGWATTGFTASSGSGLIGPSFGRTLWTLRRPAEVRVVGDRIRAVYSDSFDSDHYERPDGVLDEFLLLPDDSAETFRGFAERWGMLELCSCGWPLGHPPADTVYSEARPGSALRLAWDRSCWPPREGTVVEEDLADWRLLLRRMRAVLTLAAAYYSDDLVTPELWQPLLDAADNSPVLEAVRCYCGHGWDCVLGAAGPQVEPGRLCNADRHDQCPDCGLWRCWTRLPGCHGLGTVVDEMLDLASVRMHLTWIGPDPEVHIGGNEGLMPAFAMQLAMAMQRSDHLAICSECGAPYLVARRPDRNRRTFCPPCRAGGAPQRQASRDYRERKASAQGGEGGVPAAVRS